MNFFKPAGGFVPALLFCSLILGAANLARSQEIPECDDSSQAYWLNTVGDGLGNPFFRPESIIWDPISRYWYVSNQGCIDVNFPGIPACAPEANPQPATDGYITRLHPDGSVSDPQWATGLGTLFGLQILGDKLFVADGAYEGTLANNGIAVIQIGGRRDGEVLGGYPVGPASDFGGAFINDPVLDLWSNAIYASFFHLTQLTAESPVVKVKLLGRGAGTLDGVSFVAEPGEAGIGANGMTLYQPNFFQRSVIFGNVEGEYFSFDIFDRTPSLDLVGVSEFSDGFSILDGLEAIGKELLFTLNGRAGPTAVPSYFGTTRFTSRGEKGQLLCSLDVNKQAADIGLRYDWKNRQIVVGIPHLNQGIGNQVTFVDLEALEDARR